MTDWPTLPKVFINGKFYGDTDILGPMAEQRRVANDARGGLRRRGSRRQNRRSTCASAVHHDHLARGSARAPRRSRAGHLRLPPFARGFCAGAAALRRVARSGRVLCRRRGRLGGNEDRQERAPSAARPGYVRALLARPAASTTPRRSSPTTPAPTCLRRAYGFSAAGSVTTPTQFSTAASRAWTARGYPVTAAPSRAGP